MFEERDERDFDRDEVRLRVEFGGRSSDISAIVPYVGLERAQTLKVALEKAVAGDAVGTAYKRVSVLRRFILVAGVHESEEPAWARFLAELRSSPISPPSRKIIEQAAQVAFERYSSFTDNSLSGTANPRTRQNYWLDLQGAFKKLASVEYFPSVSLYGAIAYESGVTPVLADLAHKVGRLGPFVSWEDQEAKYLEMDKAIMAALRVALVSQFEEQYFYFNRGNELTNRLGLSVEEIDEALIVRGGFFGPELGEEGTEKRLAAALKLLRAMVFEGFKPSTNVYRLDKFFGSVGGKTALRSYLGATPRALVAAFHIMLIDTGWNSQVCADLSSNPWVGKASRGQRTIRSVASKKIRARNKLLEAPIPDFDDDVDDVDDMAETEASLPLKIPGDMSSVQVLEKWLEVSAPLRQKAESLGDPSYQAMWIWRSREGDYAISRMHDIITLWWAEFLAENSRNELFGGLPITRRIIRKTWSHIHSASGSFWANLSMALLDQECEATNKIYHPETMIRARYDTINRTFMETWEAVLITGIEDVARKLGLDAKTVELRYQLGLGSGFEFANLQPTEPQSLADDHPMWELHKSARIFVPKPESLIHLHLARLALAKAEGTIKLLNPARWMREWLPWQAILDGIDQVLSCSMYSVKYRKAIAEAERRLENSQASLPAVW